MYTTIHTGSSSSSSSQASGSPPASNHMTAAAPPPHINLTSINIFRQFLVRNPDGTLDASNVTSEQCYKTWLAIRRTPPLAPESAFKRALCGHVTAIDGRTPFDAEEEAAILRTLRRKGECWECFRTSAFKFGESGFKAKGFHEKVRSGHAYPSGVAPPKKRAKSVKDSFPTTDKRPRRPKEEEEEKNKQTFEYPELDECRHVVEPFVPPASMSLSHFANALVSTACGAASAFSLTGMPWMRGVFGAARLMLIGRGWFHSPTAEQCRAVMERMERRFPSGEDAITVLDLTFADSTKRVALQNDKSIELFGRISREHGGYNGRRFVAAHTHEIFCLCAQALTFTDPDQESRQALLHFYVKSKPTLCHVYYSTDPETHLLIERLRVAT